MFLSLTLHERNLLSLDFLENISKAATTLFLEQKEKKKKIKVPAQAAQQQQEKVSASGGHGSAVKWMMCPCGIFHPKYIKVCLPCADDARRNNCQNRR